MDKDKKMSAKDFLEQAGKDLGTYYTPDAALAVAVADPVTTAPPMFPGGESVADILRDMRAKERELWALKPPRMGNYAIALMLDAFIGRLEVAIGEAPPPRRHLDRKNQKGEV